MSNNLQPSQVRAAAFAAITSESAASNVASFALAVALYSRSEHPHLLLFAQEIVRDQTRSFPRSFHPPRLCPLARRPAANRPHHRRTPGQLCKEEGQEAEARRAPQRRR